ncbi:Imm72 family immunity protein [Nannocystis bainbridge]|uniref:Imm72 family immunity protein n=1 Tax=Nannocystis bainbridge TaxID=2995303 RepID=A0ABT5E9U3_9BACT|nr:Imm72 family immunity protein [Nannocystis bainbridge]MDC0722624.1 Imm72 family immunity protein [Nannocystis bainbridge]
MTELQTTVRPVTPADFPLDDATRAQIFYRLRRYASLTYVKRCTLLLQKFIAGFDAWARKSGPDHTQFARKALQSLYPPLAALEQVPGLLLSNQKTRAYDALSQAGFLTELLGQGFDGGMRWEPFGYNYGERPSVGLFAWAEKALEMAAQMQRTAEAGWSLSLMALQRPAPPHAHLEPMPRADGIVIDPDEDVPVTGVWVPLDVPYGCPNFLVEGVPAPLLSVETQRVDAEGYPGDPENPPIAARTDYVYEELPTRWQLAWDDIRYRAGVEIDEPEFLDDETELPVWPPAHPPSP